MKAVKLLALMVCAWGIVSAQTELRADFIDSARTQKEADMKREEPPPRLEAGRSLPTQYSVLPDAWRVGGLRMFRGRGFIDFEVVRYDITEMPD